MARHHGVTHFISESYLSEYVFRILIANGITIINPFNTSVRDYISGVPGYYNTFPKNVSAIKFLAPQISAPVVKTKTVDFAEIRLDAMLKPLKNGTGAITPFLYSYLIPALEKNSISVYPSVMPHNGRVMVTAMGSSRFSIPDMLVRMSMSNSYRNAFPYNRVSYATVDPCNSWTDPLQTIKLPKMSESKTKEAFYKLDYSDSTVLENVPVTISEVRARSFVVAEPMVQETVTPDMLFQQLEKRYRLPATIMDSISGRFGQCHPLSLARALNVEKKTDEDFFRGTLWEPYLRRLVLEKEVADKSDSGSAGPSDDDHVTVEPSVEPPELLYDTLGQIEAAISDFKMQDE